MSSQEQHLNKCVARVKEFKSVLQNLNWPLALIDKRPAPDSWSAEECLQHLVVMWELYREQLDKGMLKAREKRGDEYKMAIFGKWFANRMKPIDSGGMKTAKIFEPNNFASKTSAVVELIKAQDELLAYIEKLRKIDINKSRIYSPLSKLVRLKVGDALEIILNHQDRHFQQAERAMS